MSNNCFGRKLHVKIQISKRSFLTYLSNVSKLKFSSVWVGCRWAHRKKGKDKHLKWCRESNFPREISLFYTSPVPMCVCVGVCVCVCMCLPIYFHLFVLLRGSAFSLVIKVERKSEYFAFWKIVILPTQPPPSPIAINAATAAMTLLNFSFFEDVEIFFFCIFSLRLFRPSELFTFVLFAPCMSDAAHAIRQATLPSV